MALSGPSGAFSDTRSEGGDCPERTLAMPETGGAVVVDQLARETHQDRRKGGEPWLLRDVRAIDVITLKDSSAPSATPFSKSPSMCPIWLVTSAMLTDGWRAAAKA